MFHSVENIQTNYITRITLWNGNIFYSRTKLMVFPDFCFTFYILQRVYTNMRYNLLVEVWNFL